MVELEITEDEFRDFLREHNLYTAYELGCENQPWRQLRSHGKEVGKIEYIGNYRYRVTLNKELDSEGNAQPGVNINPV